MSIRNIIQPLDMWPRHHNSKTIPAYEGTHAIDPNGRGNGMIMRTIERNAARYELLFERMSDTPITGEEWNHLLSGTNKTSSGGQLRGAYPRSMDSFDVWLGMAHPGYAVYICNMSDMTGVEQDAFDEYHADSRYGTNCRDSMVVGLMGAYYNDPEALC